MILTAILTFLLLLFVVASLLVYLLQHKIIFAPQYYNRRRLFKEYPERYIPLELEVERGVVLEGIVYEPEVEAKKTMLYFGGREQDSVTLIAKFSLHYPHVRIIAFNYRAYGKSGGEPSEWAFHGDALKVYDYVSTHYEVPLLLGYSLGSNVAAYIATQRQPSALILVATFESVQALARSKKTPVPKMLVRHRFETIHLMAHILIPFYMFVSEDDDFVPIKQPRKLKAAVRAGMLIDYKEFQGYNHAQLLFSEEVTKEIQEVLQK